MSKKLNKYRIKERLVRAFVFATGIPAAVAVVALIGLITVAVIYANSLRDYGFAQGDVGKTMTYFAEARSALRGCIGYDDPDAIRNMRTSHDQSVEQFTQSFADLESSMVSDANKKIYRQISDALKDYWALEHEIMELGAVSDTAASKEAQERAMNELMPLYDEINDELIAIMEIKVDRGDSVSATMTAVCILLVIVIAIVIILSITFSIRLGSNIASGISKPLIQLGDRLEEFAKGDLFSPFPTADTTDEVADMIASANDMAQSLDFIIADLEHVLGQMANSDYTVRSKDGSRYVGDFKQLFDSAKKLRDCMVDTMHFIEESSIQVTAGSGNLAETAISLAEGATEQAGAVEEIQAQITTIAAAAEKAAASAEEAYQQSQRYADVANTSSEDMRAMAEAMARISETSQKIGNIIGEIDSIAEQTNLLSLNASIEAARAGEAGRGFSVVADQIRQLAEQSSKSAADTRTLIEGAMLEVENGNKIADRAVASIEIVVDGIRKVAVSSKELSILSTNQAATMKEAEQGINQISDVIQTNAAVAEESSATSQELSAQAASLDALIAKFELPA
ncbi:MAG: methyl-accepting chemotaxis protein [Candidatus Gastranaerophilales bacterium]|nr:methyl-accepting chemotaxis protein [Candidatus Gastranaerophilales bacterium]